MTYFDNGATTYPKPKSVISSVNYCIKRIGGNPSRSTHKLSMLASEEVYKTRECIAKMLNVSTPENIVFTYNATYALNLAIKTLVREKCHIIISDVEHNSVLSSFAIASASGLFELQLKSFISVSCVIITPPKVY